jgi:hypothetical protein
MKEEYLYIYTSFGLLFYLAKPAIRTNCVRSFATTSVKLQGNIIASLETIAHVKF